MAKRRFALGTMLILSLNSLSLASEQKDKNSNPSVYFGEARQALADGNYPAAGLALRKGAALMEQKSRGLPLSEAKAVREAAQRLHQLSRDLANGKVASPENIEEAIKKAEDVANGDLGQEGPRDAKDKGGLTSEPPESGSGSLRRDNPRGTGSQSGAGGQPY